MPIENRTSSYYHQTMILTRLFNEHAEKNTVVAKEDNNKRLDLYLSNRFSYYSRNEWRAIIESSLLKVNGKKVSYKKKLKTNDRISHTVFYMKEPEVEKDAEIIYDDGDLMIVSKPPNIPVIPAGRYFHNTLYSVICKKTNEKLKLLNRLDRETSGCIALSRTSDMAAAFCKMINKGSIKKIYLAVVENAKDIEEKFTAEGYISQTGHKYYRRYQSLTDDKTTGKYSKTKFKTISKNGDYALVMCRLYTGRMHQIRIHLHSKGLYIVGDKIYGREGPILFEKFVNPKGYKHEKKMLDRQALHSYKLIFKHPKTEVLVKTKSPIPKDMKSLIKKLGLSVIK